jgi:hypothetical protein
MKKTYPSGAKYEGEFILQMGPNRNPQKVCTKWGFEKQKSKIERLKTYCNKQVAEYTVPTETTGTPEEGMSLLKVKVISIRPSLWLFTR